MNTAYDLALIYAREKFKKYMKEEHKNPGYEQDVQSLLNFFNEAYNQLGPIYNQFNR